jgi:hypothetical protein
MIFLSYFKGPSSKDQQKTIRRRLITFKVTLTGQSHFLLIFVLRKVREPGPGGQERGVHVHGRRGGEAGEGQGPGDQDQV